MSVILGINAYHAGAAAAVVVDGRVVAAIAEERLNRVKYYAGFPRRAVQRCLTMAGLTLSDVDHVAIGRDPRANLRKKTEYALRNPRKLFNLVKTRSARGALDDIRQTFVQELDVAPDRLRFKQHNIEHHLAHTASAYFISPWDKATGATIDGSGDFVSSMFSSCEGPNITVKHRVFVPHSLGSLYTMICEFIGYTKYGDEGKVMGLAPLGRDTYVGTLNDMVLLTANGIELNPKYFLPFGSNEGMSIADNGEMILHRLFSDQMSALFGPPREPGTEITQRDQDLAFGVQAVFERAYMHLLNLAHRLSPSERVVLAGGCVLNSVANGKLFDQTPFRETCIQPAAGDDGLAVGAALYVSNTILGEGHRHVMRDAYLGPEYSEAEVRRALETAGVPFVRYERQNFLDTVATEIVAGKVVGWFQGRMEWGPRALGNRSILAHPGLPNMKDVLNARIKHREPFRPFAPAILLERLGDVFEHTHPSPFMLHVYKIRPEWRQRLCAVNHVDNTGRLQSVAQDENPLYYDLIKTFESRTGIPVILNTSFNENEPIVCSPEEAIECYLRTKMDVLAIGPFVCQKADGDLTAAR
jgi:carbamoyltransferase